MLMKMIRAVLTPPVLVGEQVLGVYLKSKSSQLKERTADQQRKLDEITKDWLLYEFVGCPFCVKVRLKIKELGLNIRRVNAQTDQDAKKMLIEQGGEYQVPCLRMPVGGGKYKWLYESDDINAMLEKLVTQL